MSIRDELESVLAHLPEPRIRELLDFARLLQSQDQGHETQQVQGAEAETGHPRGEVLTLNQQLSDEELAAAIQEELEFWSSLPEVPGAKPYKFDREELYADRVPRAYRH